MESNNDSTKKQASTLTYHLRDEGTDNESSGSVEEYPIGEVVDVREKLPRGAKAILEEVIPPWDRPRMKNPSHSPPHSLSQSEEDGEDKESNPKKKIMRKMVSLRMKCPSLKMKRRVRVSCVMP